MNLFNLKHKFFVLFAIIFLSSCTSFTSVSQLSEDKGYEEIKKMYQTRKFDQVTIDVNEYRIRYPYSKYTPELEILQANSFFYTKKFSTAAVTYEDFIRRNPNDPSVEFANYRIAECYDFDSSVDDDRDQANTEKAVKQYKVFISKYPNSQDYKEKSEKRLETLERRLADHSVFVAKFYWQKHLYAAALMRYLYLLDNYSQFEDIDKIARKNGAVCYNKLADKLEKKPDSEEYIFFRNETPQGLRAKAKLLEGTTES